MKNRQAKTKTAKQIPPPPGPEASYAEIIAYHSKYTLDELEEAGYAEEASPEEIRDLEESAERAIERDQVKGLAKEYPKTDRQRKPAFTALLKRLPGLKLAERKDMAHALNVMADKAHDLEEIADRLLHEAHSPEEIAELLVAFQEVTDYI